MHFTYDSQPDRENLHQGDVLVRSEGLEAILQEVHPHYFEKQDYLCFIVLTQSCDLVRRGGRSAARYISIAAARPVEIAVERFVESVQYADVERSLGFCSRKQYHKVEQFVERLLNNNEPDYFFLRGQEGTPLTSDYCGFLHLSIALKADLHYETLLASKILQLTESFQHKLGFLVSQIYGRVGTEDWVPDHLDSSEFSRDVRRRVEGSTDVLWLEPHIHKQVLKVLKDAPPREQSIEKLEEVVKGAHKQTAQRVEDLITIIVDEAEKLDVPDDVRNQLQRRLKNQPKLRGMVK